MARAKRYPGGPRTKGRKRTFFIAAATSERGRRTGPFEVVEDDSGNPIHTESKWEAEQIVNYLETRGYIAYYEVL